MYIIINFHITDRGDSVARCPKCGSNRIFGGKGITIFRWLIIIVLIPFFLLPALIAWWIWRKPMQSCADCGFVWTG
jgi:hypothetical protein